MIIKYIYINYLSLLTEINFINNIKLFLISKNSNYITLKTNFEKSE